ncbi:MAG: 1-acyl-sn-glycerol-3-phosphate acyltransferase [Clostridia bacterium]|nr:1-acyl-sn-glycerol-3-phosphate acyltransferase [Clostridia bacterium]
MSIKQFDYKKEVTEGKTYNILKPLGRFVAKLRFRIKYVGAENIPQEGGFILASNHIDLIDPMMIGLGIDNRQLHFMAKKELWKHWIVAWAFTKVNGFPIARGAADADAFKYAMQIPQKGYILGIFPEGTRSRNGKPGKPKRGVARIAAGAKCGVLPVSIYNDEGCKKHSRITIRYGKMIPYEELGFTDEKPTREEEEAATEKIFGEIVALWEEGHCE